MKVKERAVNFDSCGGDESGGKENESRGGEGAVPPIHHLTLALTLPITTPVVPAKS